MSDNLAHALAGMSTQRKDIYIELRIEWLYWIGLSISSSFLLSLIILKIQYLLIFVIISLGAGGGVLR